MVTSPPAAAAVRHPRPRPDAARRAAGRATSATAGSRSTKTGRIAGVGPWHDGARRRRARADRPPAAGAAARDGRPPRPPAAAPERGRRRGPPPARLARALHLPARARLRRGDRRAPRAGRVPGVRRRRDDDGGDVRRRLRAVAGRGVPGRRGARDPGGHRQGDDGSRQLRPRGCRRTSVLDDQPPPVRRPVQPLARARRRPPPVRVHAAVRASSCSREMLRESAALAAVRPARTGRPTCPRTTTSSTRSRGCSPRRVDYLDVYDRAGGLGPRTILAHAIHLSDREVARLAETGTAVAHCPASNLFLVVRRDAARAATSRPGSGWGSGRTCRPGRSCRSSPTCAPAPTRRAASTCSPTGAAPEPLDPLDWLRLAHARRRAGAGPGRPRSARSRRARRPT